MSLAMGILGAVSSTFVPLLSLDTIAKGILIALGMDISRSAGRFRYVYSVLFTFIYQISHKWLCMFYVSLMYEYNTYPPEKRGKRRVPK